MTALHYWATAGNAADAGTDMDTDLMAQLLEEGADPNARNKKGQTPLFLASELGDDQAVRGLFCGGAQVDIADNNDDTPVIAYVDPPWPSSARARTTSRSGLFPLRQIRSTRPPFVLALAFTDPYPSDHHPGLPLEGTPALSSC